MSPDASLAARLLYERIIRSVGIDQFPPGAVLCLQKVLDGVHKRCPVFFVPRLRRMRAFAIKLAQLECHLAIEIGKRAVLAELKPDSNRRGQSARNPKEIQPNNSKGM